MDRTKQVIVVLLFLAILFSVGSIFISLNSSNVTLPERSVSGDVTGNGLGGVALVIENSIDSGGGG